MDLARMAAWTQANWWTVLAVVVYLIANLWPRPHPETLTGRSKTFWLIVDRLCVLTAAAVPGKLKWMFLLSPSPTPAVAEAVKDEVKTP